MFQPKPNLKTSGKFKILRFFNYKTTNFLFYYYFPGEIKVNPGPERKISKFSCCHWNANSILAHDKLSLIKSYNTVQKYDIIYISETFLDSSVNENTFLIPGYHLVTLIWVGFLRGKSRGKITPS